MVKLTRAIQINQNMDKLAKIVFLSRFRGRCIYADRGTDTTSNSEEDSWSPIFLGEPKETDPDLCQSILLRGRVKVSSPSKQFEDTRIKIHITRSSNSSNVFQARESKFIKTPSKR